MKTLIITLGLIALFNSNLNGQLVEQWSQETDVEVDIIRFEYPELSFDSAGNLLVIGNNNLIKYDEDGTEIWKIEFENNHWGAYGIGRFRFCFDELDNIYIIYNEADFSDPDLELKFVFVSKFSKDGLEIWNKQLDYFELVHQFEGTSIVYLNGNVFVTGNGDKENSELDIFIAGFDAETGSEIWNRKYSSDGDFNDWPNRMFKDSNGDLLIAGRSSGIGQVHYLLLKYDQAGNLLFSKESEGIDDEPNVISYSNMLQDDQIFISGSKWESVVFSNNGDVAWNYRPISYLPENVFGDGISTSTIKEDYLILSGSHRSNLGGRSILTCKLDKNGTELWRNRFELDDGQQNGITYASAINKEGDVLIGGTITHDDNKIKSILIKINGIDGTLMWSWVEDLSQTSYEIITSILISEDNEIYTTGFFEDGIEKFYFTKKYLDLTSNLTPDLKDNLQITISPNPSSTGAFFLNSSQENQTALQLTVYNDIGQKVTERSDYRMGEGISLASAGVYFVSVVGADGIFTGKVVLVE